MKRKKVKLTAKLKSPPPYRVGELVSVNVGYVGLTKTEIKGNVVTVLADRVTVIVGGKAVTFMNNEEAIV